MSNSYSLDQLRADLDKEFAPLQLEVKGGTLTLRNLLRINEGDRAKVLDALTVVQEKFSDDEKEQSAEDLSAATEALSVIFRAVVADGKGDKLITYLDGDLALAMKILGLWTEATQPGEAEHSPN